MPARRTAPRLPASRMRIAAATWRRPLVALALAAFTGLATGGAALAAASGDGLPAGLFAPPPSVPDGAFGEGAFDGIEDRAELRLLVDRTSVAPGEPFRVGVLFDLDPGWHIYWRSPGDSGLPTELLWQSEQAGIGPTRWTTPHTFAEAEGLITTYGYAGRVLLPAEATASQEPGGAVKLAVEARFLACEVTCVPGQVKLSRVLPVGDGAPAPREVVALFEVAEAARPVEGETLGLEAQAVVSQSAVRPGDEFRVALAVGCQGRRDCSPPELASEKLGYAYIPDLVDGLELSVADVRAHPLSPGDWLVELEGRAGAAAFEGDTQRVGGIAGLIDPDTKRPIAAELAFTLPRAPKDAEVVAIAMPWEEGAERIAQAAAARAAASTAAEREDATAPPAAGGDDARDAPAPPAASASAALPLGRALLLALLGGLILNLMPCVLPVLAIKVFAMTELAHASRREVLQHGAAYGAGVVGSMWVLAAAVVALRAGGETIGWGFQFQDPLFVAAISAVLVVFALNLFGVFEIFAPTGGLADVGAGASGPRRSFFEGLLAVVLATPCSAPFLGTAVGFAFAGDAATIFGIFSAIGVGLAAPFVAVTLVPAWARFVPRSGTWMNTLRAGLGFAVLATVVWLLWVVGRLVGPDGIAALLAFLVAVAFASWVYGVLQAAGRTLPARAVALTGTLAALGLLTALPLQPEPANAAAAPASSAEAAPATDDATLAWAPDTLARTLADGRPAFVYFTADWCITCKVNERGTLASDAVRNELDALGFRVLKGDWTQRDDAIAAELARFGKGGVPMYLVYDPRRPDAPAVLPELLTPSGVVEALRAAAPGA